jgi:hypothetical protein
MATDDFNVIGISGKAGSGKDYITQKFLIPRGFCQFSFAWHFKIWLVGTKRCTHEEVFVTKPPHVRKLMQEEGTERGRNVYGETVWVDTMFAWMRVLNENSGITNFVVPDVRFPNEALAIQERGGKVIRMVAPKRVAASPLSEEARNHVSELALDPWKDEQWDGFIYNDPEHAETVGHQLFNLLDLERPADSPEDMGLLEAIRWWWGR